MYSMFREVNFFTPRHHAKQLDLGNITPLSVASMMKGCVIRFVE